MDGNSNYLIDTYKDRLNERNREYEQYYFKNLRKILLGNNITKIGIILNVIILLILFINGQITIGLFIAMTGIMFDGIYSNLESFAGFFRWSAMHINTYNYLDKFFELSDELEEAGNDLPETYDVEFKNVWFRYPGTDKDILKGINFKIKNGEKVSIVGENGGGKSTLIKLLLGLFSPDQGEILIGGKKINEYPLRVRTKIFGPVFQDFSRYSITIKENIGIGHIDEINNKEKIKIAAHKAKADNFIEKYENSYDTLLGNVVLKLN